MTAQAVGSFQHRGKTRMLSEGQTGFERQALRFSGFYAPVLHQFLAEMSFLCKGKAEFSRQVTIQNMWCYNAERLSGRRFVKNRSHLLLSCCNRGDLSPPSLLKSTPMFNAVVVFSTVQLTHLFEHLKRKLH